MNVGGLKLNGVIAHALVSAKMFRVCVLHLFEQTFATSVQSVRFCRRLKTEKHERIAGVSASLACPSAVGTLHLCSVKEAVCNAGKRPATTLITQLVSYPGSSLGSSKLGSRLRNGPLVCP